MTDPKPPVTHAIGCPGIIDNGDCSCEFGYRTRAAGLLAENETLRARLQEAERRAEEAESALAEEREDRRQAGIERGLRD